MRPLVTKLTPSKGFSQILHLVFNLVLPFLVFFFVRMGFVQLALSLILLSKWRMFAVRPRFWVANIRANAVDIIIGLSMLAFLVSAASEWLQLVLVGVWAVWLLVIKPKSSVFWVSLQALIGFAAGLMALFLVWDQGSLLGLTLASGLLCFFAAHHFFDNFDEPYTRLLSYTWAYFGSALTWVLAHWLLFYGPIAQPTLLLVTLGFGLGTLYYLDHFDRVTPGLRRQFIFIMVAMVLVVLTFSDWGDKIV
ncbi:hypothetical protein EYC59_03055 [Candidatus Saccharibacteria bacterium]|nr:MAG: hypothetical protein EYC59_03055 [Candidatus Saccharibacteria bacterium]